MPSPGIRFGDLMVFVAVLMVVAVFLAFVRALIRHVEAPDQPQGAEPDSSREAPPSEGRAPAAHRLESPHSATQ